VQILGDTLDKIAGEKAGIIKMNTPTIIGKTQPQTASVFNQKAAALNSPISFADQYWTSEITEDSPSSLSIQLTASDQSRQYSYTCPLAGSYQQENIITVRVAIDQLRKLDWEINDESIQKGITHVIANTGLHGRWETISSSPLIILDVAHNADGVNKMLEQLKRFNFNQLFLVLGISADKDVNEVLSLLPKQAEYAFTKAHLPRALDPLQLKAMAETHQLKGEIFENVNDGIQHFKNKANNNDLILVCGSIFVVGEVNRKQFFSN
jgi:dihydrofolate synthase/folylpolyglutamate synthase